MRLIALLVCGLLLAGCGSTPEKPAATPSPSPTRTTPPVPAMPEAAKENTKAGAEAFVRYWVSLANYGQRTGNTRPVRMATLPSCRACLRAAAKIDDVYRAGGEIHGGEMRLGAVIFSNRTSARAWALGMAITAPGQVVIEHAGAEPKSTKGGRFLMNFSLQRKSSGWRLADWTRA